MLEAMELAPPAPYLPRDFVYKVAREPFELSGFWALRRRVFCDEQKLFSGSDRDPRDRAMIPLVCVSLALGVPDAVVGVVRIDEREPGIWWGSRLAVHEAFRRIDRVSPGVAQRNHLPSWWRNRSIGAGLIFKAVSTAHALGCRTFLAHVQTQNVRFFEHLRWKRLAEVQVHDRPHFLMRADLSYYPRARHDLPASSMPPAPAAVRETVR